MITVWTIVSGEERKTIKQFVRKHFPECAVEYIYPAKSKKLLPDVDEQLRLEKAGHSRIPLGRKALKGKLRKDSNPRLRPGASGGVLVNRLKELLPDFVGQIQRHDIILVVDDLDCYDQVRVGNVDGTEHRRNALQNQIRAIVTQGHLVIGFAKPEMEAWVVADWHNVMRSSANFSRCYHQMQRYLKEVHHIPFDAPETFGKYDKQKDTCTEKLSLLIVQCTMLPYSDDPTKDTNRIVEQRVWPFTGNVSKPFLAYDKALHTPMFLEKMNIKTVREKCPMFNRFFAELSRTVDLATVGNE